MTQQIYHYSGQFTAEDIRKGDGKTYAIRRSDGTFVIWNGPTSRGGTDENGPIVFAEESVAQQWIDDLAAEMPDGRYEVVAIEPILLLIATGNAAPTVFWTRIDQSYGFIIF